MNSPERRTGDPFAPVTRTELEAALSSATSPIRQDVAALRADLALLREHSAMKADLALLQSATKADVQGVREEVAALREDVAVVRVNLAALGEHAATKADVQAMGLRIVMWTGGLLAVFVSVMGWLVGSA